MPRVPFNPHAPNALQEIPLAWIEPSEENVRLFVARGGLGGLSRRYAAAAEGQDVILPDAPVLRFLGYREARADDVAWTTLTPTGTAVPKLELLSGERRVTAATFALAPTIPARVATMSDREAFEFILEANEHEGLTTAELAIRAAEMDRLGYGEDEIKAALKGAEPYRYIAVGQLLDPAWFTDAPKLCDPSIVEWFDASRFGKKHLETCFRAWDAGEWDAKAVSKHFRLKGRALPSDTAEKGTRVTFSENRLVLRGTVDLGVLDEDAALRILIETRDALSEAIDLLDETGGFGPKSIRYFNPDTLPILEAADEVDVEEEFA
jgi:hypothetical protein